VAGKHEMILGAFLGNADEWSRQISNLRNEFTHPTSVVENAQDNFLMLLVLSEKMSLLLEVCFLDEIGFTQEQIKLIVTNRSRRTDRINGGLV
jgi:hypothetical protein